MTRAVEPFVSHTSRQTLRFSAVAPSGDAPKPGAALPKDSDLTNALFFDLMHANGSNKEALRAFISKNAEKLEFNEPSAERGIPLVHMLAQFGDMELFRLGVIRGADPFVKNSDGETALHAAVMSGNPEMVKCFLNLCFDVDQMGTVLPNTPLMKAAESGNAEVLNMLLDHGAKINRKCWNGETALTKACAAKGLAYNPAVVRSLLARGADATVKDDSDVTPLMTMAQNKRPQSAELMQALIDKGANVNARDKHKNSVWRYAPFGSIDGVRCLLGVKGVDVNGAAPGQMTPVQQMAVVGNLEGFKLLEAAGADVQVKTDFGADVLALAAKAMKSAAGYDPAPLIQYLVDKGFDVNTRDRDGKTPVVDLCSRGIHDGLDTLLTNKADVNLSDGKGKTALMVAAARGDMDVIKKLIAHGAKLDIQDNAGMTAVMHAAHCGQAALVDALIALGANPGLKDAAERDLAHYQVSGNLLNLFKL